MIRHELPKHDWYSEWIAIPLRDFCSKMGLHTSHPRGILAAAQPNQTLGAQGTQASSWMADLCA